MPDAQNAFTYFERASASMTPDTVQRVQLLELTWRRDTVQAVAILRANAKVMDLVEQGTKLTRSQAPIRYSQPSGDAALQAESSRYDRLTAPIGLFMIRAGQLMADHKTAQAINDVRTAIAFARLLRASGGTTEVLWAADLTLTEHVFKLIQTWARDKHTDAKILRALAAVVSEISWPVSDAQESIRSSYKFFLAALEEVRKPGSRPDFVLPYFFHTVSGSGPDFGTVSTLFQSAWSTPGWNPGETREWLLEDARVSSVRLADCDYASDGLKTTWDAQTAGVANRSNRLGVVLRAAANAQLGTMVDIDCSARVAGAFLAVELGIRAYKLEHKALPVTLSALVPSYLKRHPRCSYRDQPIGYDAKAQALTCPGRGGVPSAFRWL